MNDVNKKQKYKALMLDVDGTLVPNRRDGMPSDIVKAAVTRAQEKVYVCIATGRDYSMVESVVKKLNIITPVIVSGGLQIINPIDASTVWEKKIEHKDIKKILEIVKKYSFVINIATGKGDIPYYEGYNLDNCYGFFTPPLSVQEADTFIEDLSQIPTIDAHKTSSWEAVDKVHVSIGHVMATKQHAILEVAKMLGIKKDEIIGVGDHYNDFPLLMASGLKVAMGNAVEDLKAIADYVAPSVEEDGVADVIEKFIL